MDTETAIDALGALANPQRLAVFRMLMQTRPSGLSAGVIAQNLGMPPSSMSFHLRHLERAGLLKSRRDRRHIIYAADPGGIETLVRYLCETCGEGDVVVSARSESQDRGSAAA